MDGRADHPNFYENMPEAQMRLCNTVVLYDHSREKGDKVGAEPYYVLAITNHKKDNIFRIYLMPLSNLGDTGRYETEWPRVPDFMPNSNELGEYLDKWMESHPKVGVLRKMMNSPAFNQFRPFPLGMWHYGDTTFYLARQPQRHREQGLTRASISCHKISLDPQREGTGYPYGLGGASLRDTILGLYPPLEECLTHIRNPEERQSVGFHRDFAIVRGPLKLIFLVHKTEVVGYIPNIPKTEAHLDPSFRYLKEVVENTNAFSAVRIKES